MRNDKSDFLKGTLDMLILKIVALGPIHGYAIALRVQQISNEVFQLQQGSLYPALHKLEKEKLLSSQWKETETGREAKFYSLTAKGRKQLESEVENWERLSGAVSLILSTVE
jgi:transcriptional regulator